LIFDNLILVPLVGSKLAQELLQESYVSSIAVPTHRLEGNNMAWETPAFADVRFGFEVTMYISNR